MKIFKALLSLVVGTRILGNPPTVGEVYVLDRLYKGNPFDTDDRPHATVLAVNGSWVQYRIGKGLLSPDSCSIRTFLAIYTKKNDA